MAKLGRYGWSLGLLPVATGLGVVLLEAVRQIEAPTTRALIAGGGLVVTYVLGVLTKPAELRDAISERPAPPGDGPPSAE